MQEVNLVADIIIAMLEGIKSKKHIKKFYATYEKSFEYDTEELERRFVETINIIGMIYPEGLSNSESRRNHLFYTLFTMVYHCRFGLAGLDAPRPPLMTAAEIERARNALDRVGEIYATPDTGALTREERQFLQDSRRATTDETVRERRTKFLLGLMG